MHQKAGRIAAAGMTKEIGFEPVSGPIDDHIDDAHREKYNGSPYLEPMTRERTRAGSEARRAYRSRFTRICCVTRQATTYTDSIF